MTSEKLFLELFKTLLTLIIILPFYNITDLNFKTQMRSAVSVREGQGVVLLCGTPIYAGGEALKRYLTIFSLWFINDVLTSQFL